MATPCSVNANGGSRNFLSSPDSSEKPGGDGLCRGGFGADGRKKVGLKSFIIAPYRIFYCDETA
ncbi:MAG: hypothetical protein NT126_03275 [Bacteroidetes bacterium]|nr:hypothetical protein [Bacteroidota bacterium]